MLKIQREWKSKKKQTTKKVLIVPQQDPNNIKEKV